MNCRPATEKDLPRLVELYRNGGVAYKLPDLFSEEFAAVQVLVDEDDRVVMCCAARKTVELYFLLDKKWRTPKWRWQFFIVLHGAVIEDAQHRDVFAFLT